MKNIDLHYYRNTDPMASQNMVTAVIGILILVAFLYLIDPTFFGLLKRRSISGFENMIQTTASAGDAGVGMHTSGSVDKKNTTGNTHSMGGDMNTSSQGTPVENFADLSTMEGPAEFGSAGEPAGCYPRDQLMPSELLPKDQNSVWAEQNPMGPGSLKGKNFLSAGALIGVNTVGQSLRNANWQLRSEPPNPQVPVSIFNQSTIMPDVNRRPLEIS